MLGWRQHPELTCLRHMATSHCTSRPTQPSSNSRMFRSVWRANKCHRSQMAPRKRLRPEPSTHSGRRRSPSRKRLHMPRTLCTSKQNPPCPMPKRYPAQSHHMGLCSLRDTTPAEETAGGDALAMGSSARSTHLGPTKRTVRGHACPCLR